MFTGKIFSINRMELESALTTKEDTFTIRDIHTIAELMNQAALQVTSPSMAALEREMMAAQLSVDKDAF